MRLSALAAGGGVGGGEWPWWAWCCRAAPPRRPPTREPPGDARAGERRPPAPAPGAAASSPEPLELPIVLKRSMNLANASLRGGKVSNGVRASYTHIDKDKNTQTQSHIPCHIVAPLHRHRRHRERMRASLCRRMQGNELSKAKIHSERTHARWIAQRWRSGGGFAANVLVYERACDFCTWHTHSSSNRLRQQRSL